MSEMPHVCPHCGKRFGWGPAVALLAVVRSAPFDELTPCCGKRITGYVVDGIPDFDPVEDEG